MPTFNKKPEYKDKLSHFEVQRIEGASNEKDIINEDSSWLAQFYQTPRKSHEFFLLEKLINKFKDHCKSFNLTVEQGLELLIAREVGEKVHTKVL